MYGIKQKLMSHTVMNSQRHSLRPFSRDAMKAAPPILRACFEYLSNLSNATLGAITIHSHTIQDNNSPTGVAFGFASSNRATSLSLARNQLQ